MGYSENSGAGNSAGSEFRISKPIIVFISISMYNVIELNILILTTFKKRNSLYFWSFLVATNGIVPHAIGFLLKNVLFSDNFMLFITLISVGWVMMVTGQSLVLYSRLHLILWNRFYRRLVLAMIITNALILHVPIIILMYGSNSSHTNPFVHPYAVYEKIQVTIFFLQEVIISTIYIKTCFSFFDTQVALHGNSVRRMCKHLLVVNVIIIFLDIPILVLEYTDLYDFQTAYKALVYSVKLKLEFNILNRLVEMSHGNNTSGSHSQGPGTRTATAIEMNTFNGDESGGNITHRAYAHGGEHGGAKRGKMGKRSLDNGIMRSTEITVHCVEQREEDSESMEQKSMRTRESHFRTMEGMGGYPSLLLRLI
ncbi:hypothetical protein B0J13DRAFT_526107 [Dactylonectria estremocensis]|uniref:DUF7703 domain-containing protein n=1 Tax=Dactylonectria estremocensis TaxID=1079267 RepID=A0A9P9ERM2_9HYPO|nr:hypothetical protein B0J13DRAFT_526107 [Dactylonectria estremocensis]